MTKENYIGRLGEVEEDLEEMIVFEKKALDSLARSKIYEQVEKKIASKLIIGRIVGCTQSLYSLRNYFPELKKEG